MSRDDDEELFGEAALCMGWATAESLYVALTVQKHG
jgi:hypothetical protein